MLNRENVQKIMDEKIRPGLAMDGGDIELVDVKDNKVFVKLTGACGTCPMSMMTLKMGVERVLKSEFAELEEIVNMT